MTKNLADIIVEGTFLGICTWKFSYITNGSTFEDVKRENHKLYKCIDCSGEKGACPNHSDHYELLREYSSR